MKKKKSLSRRNFLRGTGQVMIALPFLESFPSIAMGQSGAQKRYVLMYYGSCNGGTRLTLPSRYGALNQPFLPSLTSLESMRSKVSLVSSLNLPQHYSGNVPPPGEATGAQHGKMESPMLSGVRSVPKTATNFDNRYSFIRGTTSDQIAAQFLGAGSKFDSLQIRTQAVDYNGRTNPNQAISVVKNGSILNELRPIISPLELYEKIFSGGSSSPSQPPVSQLPLKKKSVLDLVLDDAQRIENSVTGQDKERLQLHFENIRKMERNLASANTGSSGGGSTSGSCGSAPNSPGPDPSISDYGFGGWANETKRGNNQADLVAYALQCGLTNVATWAITYSQCWINSEKTGNSNTSNPNSSKPDIHADSHHSSADIKAANHNWAVQFFNRLITNLDGMSEGSGSVLDNTFVVFVTAEGASAHNRSQLSYLYSGCPDKVNLGQHINGNNNYPQRLLISGLNAIGMNTNTLGETTGKIAGVLK